MLLFEENDPYLIQLQLLKNLHENQNHKKKRSHKILRDLADLRLNIVFFCRMLVLNSQYCKFYIARSNLFIEAIKKKKVLLLDLTESIIILYFFDLGF